MKLITLLVLLGSTLAFAQDESGEHIDLDAYSINEHQIQLGDSVIDKEDLLSTRGATAFFAGKSWTGGVLPLVFDSDVTASQRKLFFAACAEWEAAARITCKARGGEARYLFVQKKKDECSSGIGMGMTPWTSKRVLNLSDGGCWNHRTILHELGHALGLIHEHQRGDRNQFITIHRENVSKDGFGNFFRIFWSKEHSAYDFESVMHYSEFAFSKEYGRLVTIEAKPGYEQYQSIIGTARWLSEGDKETARDLYGQR